MKKSLLALAVMAASGCAVASSRRNYDDQARGHELRALDLGGLEASLKAQRATFPAAMPNDGRAVWITDKAILGASPGVGTPAITDTIDFLVPAGTRLTDLAFVADRVDSNGSPTFAASIGYRPVSANDGSLVADPVYFAAAAALYSAVGKTRTECVFKPIKFEQDVYITFTVTAVAATLTSNPEIHMIAGGNAEGIK